MIRTAIDDPPNQAARANTRDRGRPVFPKSLPACGSACTLGKMKHIDKCDWDQVHQLACEIVNASAQDDIVLSESKKESLMALLRGLERKYGPCSRITATEADFTEGSGTRLLLYRKALRQAISEGDTENQILIDESIIETINGSQTA
jgi:hypothetical protein